MIPKCYDALNRREETIKFDAYNQKILMVTITKHAFLSQEMLQKDFLMVCRATSITLVRSIETTNSVKNDCFQKISKI